MADVPSARSGGDGDFIVSVTANELVALAQVRPEHRGDDLAEPTQRAAELLDVLEEFELVAKWAVFDRLRSSFAVYEVGNGTSARNPVLDAITERALRCHSGPQENVLALAMIDRGAYPLHMNDIVAFGIGDTARLIHPAGPRSDHFLTDVGALTMVLEGRWSRPDGRSIGLGAVARRHLQGLRVTLSEADVHDSDRDSVGVLIAAIDRTIVAGGVVPDLGQSTNGVGDATGSLDSRREQMMAHLANGDIGLDNEVLLTVGVAEALKSMRPDGATGAWFIVNLRALTNFLTSDVEQWKPNRSDIQALVELRDDLLVPNRYNAGVIGDGQVASNLIGQISALAHALKVLPRQDVG